jgi:hypothetical protein
MKKYGKKKVVKKADRMTYNGFQLAQVTQDNTHPWLFFNESLLKVVSSEN